jgi:SAM-dependent methyltransferase
MRRPRLRGSIVRGMIAQAVDADAFNAFEAAGWEERADSYHRFFGSLTTRVIEPLLDAAEVGAQTQVLDLATGPGYAAAAACGRGATVVGVDVAAEMVALARRLHPRLEFVQASAERLPFADGSFDAVVGNLLILHVGRPEQVAAEIARVLAPGGTAALSTWDVPERTRLLGVFLDAAHEAGAEPLASVPAGPPFFRFADEREFTRLLEGAGLNHVEVETVAFTHRQSSADELWDGCRDGTVRMRAIVFGQPEQTLVRIRASFDRLVGEYTAGDGSVELPVSVKVAAGRKGRKR